MEIVQPPGWSRPRGYAHGVAAAGRLVFVSGQIGWDARGDFPALDFVGQARQALRNVVAVVAAAGGRPEHLARLTWYITDKPAYLSNTSALGQAYRAVVGDHYPAMSVVQVAALLDDRALVEIEATAIIPD